MRRIANLVSYIALRTIGEQVLVQRSVHSSVIDGIALAGLDASFVIPVVAHAIPAGHESAGEDSVLARDPRPPSRCRYAHGRSDPRTIRWDNGFRIPALCSASAPTAAYAPTSTRLARIRSKLGRDKGHGCSVNSHGENQIGDLCRLRQPGAGDDEGLGSPGVGMHC